MGGDGYSEEVFGCGFVINLVIVFYKFLLGYGFYVNGVWGWGGVGFVCLYILYFNLFVWGWLFCLLL